LLTTFGVGWLAPLCWGGVLQAPSAAAATTTEKEIAAILTVFMNTSVV
jgi:hypothetical protein